MGGWGVGMRLVGVGHEGGGWGWTGDGAMVGVGSGWGMEEHIDELSASFFNITNLPTDFDIFRFLSFSSRVSMKKV